jgi:hypothetical protein
LAAFRVVDRVDAILERRASSPAQGGEQLDAVMTGMPVVRPAFRDSRIPRFAAPVPRNQGAVR